VRLVHDDAPLATHVEVADSFPARARGLMFRRSLPEGHALVFEFGRPVTRSLHMLFVPFPIDALWLVDGRVTRVAQLDPWTGLARGRADTIVELPAGATDGLEPGDVVRVVGEGEGVRTDA
jgi:uncharacterized protein